MAGPSPLSSLPDKLRICWADYEIKVRRIKEDDDGESFGKCHNRDQWIELEKDQKQACAIDSAIHEVLHAIWYTQNIPGKAKEERVVTDLANGLLQVLRDNPKFLEWLAREIPKL